MANAEEKKPEYISLGKAAKVYGVSRKTMHNWVKSGKLKAITTVGNHYRVDLNDVIALRNAQTTTKRATALKVMIVDDDPIAVKMVETIVSKAFSAAAVVTYTNGYDALLAVKTETPSVILLDLNMPKMDGYEFVKALTSDKELQDVTVVVVSSYLDSEAKEHLREMNVTKWVEKTAVHERLAVVLADVLRDA